MKLPAIKSKIGNWDYYTTTLTFQQVRDYVQRVDEELYHSQALKDLIQRSITNNYLSIREYILKQPELFFNSLVLAVYDDYPTWHQVVINLENEKINNFGLLEFPGQHKIFPVDGQHRVEGIKEALKENPSLKTQQIAAIFVGHKADEKGRTRTRRLFTTLNRYAKPVSLRDSIALDEDDVVAIITRDLLEEFDLFCGERVIDTKTKAIPVHNMVALTSIITLYQANTEIFRCFLEKKHTKMKLSKQQLDTYLKFRPPLEEIETFKRYCFDYWNSFKTNMKNIQTYLKLEASPASQFRNSNTGGDLIFRPVGFLPFIKASIEIRRRTNQTFAEIFKRMSTYNLGINGKPWVSVVWNAIEKKMIMNTSTLIFLILIYKFEEKLLTRAELKRLKEGYAAQAGLTKKQMETVWKEIF